MPPTSRSPGLNAFSYWLFLFGGLIVLSGFLTPGGAADFGWFAYTPLSDAIHSPGYGGDLWITGLILAGLGTILAAVAYAAALLNSLTRAGRGPACERGTHRRGLEDAGSRAAAGGLWNR